MGAAGAYLEPVLVLDAAVLAQGVVQPAAVRLVVCLHRVEPVVPRKDVPRLEHARRRVYERPGRCGAMSGAREGRRGSYPSRSKRICVRGGGQWVARREEGGLTASAVMECMVVVVDWDEERA